jgi:hypothetical protein
LLGKSKFPICNGCPKFVDYLLVLFFEEVTKVVIVEEMVVLVSEDVD